MEFISNEISIYPQSPLFEVTEMTADWYYHFKGCVPPIWTGRTRTARIDEAFMVGEPNSHTEYDGEWVPVYRMCIKDGDRYFSVLVPENFGSSEFLNILEQVKAA